LKKVLGAVTPRIFLINVTKEIAGQNKVILKRSHGIYRFGGLGMMVAFYVCYSRFTLPSVA
jgi:hypothetical protein